VNRRTRRRIVVVGFCALAGVSVPLWVPPMLGSMSMFRVEHVRVTGTRHASPDRLLQLAGIKPTASVFDDPAPWEARIRADALVRQVRVHRAGFHSIELRVTEVEPVAFAIAKRLVPLDRDGRVMPIDPAAQHLDLPILDARPALDGGRLRGDSARALLAALVRLHDAEPGFVRQISEVRARAGGALECRMIEESHAQTVVLPLAAPVRGLARVKAALTAMSGSGLTVRSADARFSGQVVLRVEEGS